MFQGGTVKRTDGYWPMKPLEEAREELFYIFLFRLATPYQAPGDVDFAFVAYPWYRPRGLRRYDHTLMPFVINGFGNPNGQMVAHNLTFAIVKDAYNENFCKKFYQVDKYVFAEGPRQMINCFNDISCRGNCETGMNTEQMDDGGGLYFKATNILVTIAHTRAVKKLGSRGVPLVGYVEKTQLLMMQYMGTNLNDEFDDYPEYSPGTDLFL